MANVVTRIKDFLDYKGISVSAFEKSIGMSNASFGKSLKNGGAIGSDKLEKILNIYRDLHPIWLLTGEGSMLIDDSKDDKIPQKNEISDIFPAKQQGGLPYFDKDMVEQYSKSEGTRISIDDYFVGRADFYCTCCEHGMSPSINYGDILALRECKIQNIIFGEVYAIVLDEERLIRQIKRSENKDHFTLVPFNREDFQPQDFPVSRIKNVYRIVGSIHRFS